jgi:hypothetical protein
MRWLVLTAALGLTLPSRAPAQPTGDACRNQIPRALGLALQRQFPKRHLPSVSDSSREDVQSNQTRGGNGCLLVARADFDGDGREDIAIGLPPRAGRAPLVAVALKRDPGWTVSTIRSWVNDIGRLYVDSAPPGIHHRVTSLDVPLKQNERESLRCDHAAVALEQPSPQGLPTVTSRDGGSTSGLLTDHDRTDASRVAEFCAYSDDGRGADDGSQLARPQQFRPRRRTSTRFVK